MHTLKLEIHENVYAHVLKFLATFDRQELSIVEEDFIPQKIQQHMENGKNVTVNPDQSDLDDFEMELESIIRQYENNK